MNVPKVVSLLRKVGIETGISDIEAAMDHLQYGIAERLSGSDRIMSKLRARREAVLSEVAALPPTCPTSSDAAVHAGSGGLRAWLVLEQACENWKLLADAHEALVEGDLQKPIDKMFLQTRSFPPRELGLTTTAPAGGGGTPAGLLALARSENAWTPTAYEASSRRGEWERSFSDDPLVPHTRGVKLVPDWPE